MGDFLVFVDEKVEYFFVQLSESLKIFWVFDFEVYYLINVLTRVNGPVLCFSLFPQLGLEELSVIG